MAIADDASAKDTDRYTRAANRTKMARSGMEKLRGKLGRKVSHRQKSLKKVRQIEQKT